MNIYWKHKWYSVVSPDSGQFTAGGTSDLLNRQKATFSRS